MKEGHDVTPDVKALAIRIWEGENDLQSGDERIAAIEALVSPLVERVRRLERALEKIKDDVAVVCITIATEALAKEADRE